MIELDASQHNSEDSRAYDAEWTVYLEALRLRVV
ncbi:MAG: hypothetical protein RR285_14540 [Acinetobacter sp.]